MRLGGESFVVAHKGPGFSARLCRRRKDTENTSEVKVLHDHVILHVTQMSRNGKDTFNVLRFCSFKQPTLLFCEEEKQEQGRRELTLIFRQKWLWQFGKSIS